MTPIPRPTSSAGFTLVELLVTIAIAGVLFGIGIPSFREVINNNRLTTQSNAFLSALTYARSEAIKRGVDVTLLNQGAVGDWSAGWVIFIDNGAGTNSGNKQLDDDESAIRVFEALPSAITLTTTDNGNTFIFKSSGFLSPGSNKTLYLCSNSNSNSYRNITVSTLGRVKIEEQTGSCPQ